MMSQSSSTSLATTSLDRIKAPVRLYTLHPKIRLPTEVCIVTKSDVGLGNHPTSSKKVIPHPIHHNMPLKNQEYHTPSQQKGLNIEKLML